jgi:beta-lactamase superfamily II metal-dependent hydrolase
MKTVVSGIVALSLAAVPSAQSRANSAMTVYVVDVEGGNATLIVSPSRESLLIDTGNPGARDADRIAAAAKDAGLSRIDNLITTHYHSDHVGGVADLSARLPIARFIDHGPNVEQGQGAARLDDAYAAAYAKGSHLVVKPGDQVPVAGLDVRIVSAAGQVLKKPLPGGGKPNPFCAAFKPQDPDTTENAQSVGSVITLGKFRMVHLGDLTTNKEFELMCPANPIGAVDLFIVSHHGLSVSNAPILVHALHPRVAIMNNGVRKGGTPETMTTLYASPGLEDVWQLHFSQLGGQEYAVPGLFIANPSAEPNVQIAPLVVQPRGSATPTPPAPAHDGPANWIKVTALPDGSFTVVNSRNNFSKTYSTPTR